MKKFYCNKCGNQVTLFDITCPHCGNENIANKDLNKTFRCSKCGRVIEPGEAFCPKCGKDVTQDMQIENYRVKDTVIGLCWCLTFGIFGAHKFYEGRIIMGIAYILTFGLFGLGWIKDLFSYLFHPSRYYLVPKGLLKGIYW